MTTRKGIEVEENLKLERVEWRVARVPWTILLLLIAATLLGVFGDGPLSRVAAGSPDGPLWTRYDRALRFGSSTDVLIRAPIQPDGTLRLSIDRTLLDAFQVERITPQPAATTLDDSAVEYGFTGSAGAGASIVFTLQPTRRGLVGGAIRSADGRVELRQFVFP